jgi:hypothetical protein
LVFVHVHEVAPEFCASCPVTSCPQIVQHTDLSGPLEFDLFFAPIAYGPDETISSFSGTFEWPVGWTLIDHEICPAGTGTIEPSGNRVEVNVTWPDCPPCGELFLVARLVLNVSGHGSLATAAGEPPIVTLGCPPGAFEVHAYAVGGEAGVECAYCFQPCDLSAPCRPVPDPPAIALQVAEGGTVGAEIQVSVGGGSVGWPCQTSFSCTESWMQLEVEEIGPDEYRITLSADAAGLGPGSYRGWVRMADTCVGCTRVDLTVSPLVSVPDPGIPLRIASWGGVKSKYR